MKKEETNKKSLMDRLKDKRERAKIELIFYFVFFIALVIFIRVGSSSSDKVIDNNENNVTNTFIEGINDNYEYSMLLTINDTIYEYYGKVLGNNSTINKLDQNITKKYYSINQKYYMLDNDNYILINKEEVYPYIDSLYLSIDTIKEYILISNKNNNTYSIKVKDILLNSSNEDSITITINEGDKNIIIDYTNLFKETKENIEKIEVNITYNNINNITSLEE